MKKTRKDLEQQVEALNELLGGEKYYLEVLNYKVYGPYRYRLEHLKTSSMPLCTWDHMPCVEMYQYLRGAIVVATSIGMYNNKAKK